MNPEGLLGRWLSARLEPEQARWLEDCAARLRNGAGDRELYLAISLVSRRLGKADLELSAGDLEEAARSRPGWDPGRWSLEQAARVYLLLASDGSADDFARRLERLCSAADVGELVALYQGLPLYPDPPRHVLRAAEGVRSNMRAVFEAVAHRNPYPAEQFPEQAWNQMVLKALFVGSPLAPIVGLAERANPALAVMLRDYAHERWAASRPVSPELWRCVGPFAAGEALEDFKRLLAEGGELDRLAAALALEASADPAAAVLLDSTGVLAESVRQARVSWESLGARLAAEQ
jgi:hypothetical protein